MKRAATLLLMAALALPAAGAPPRAKEGRDVGGDVGWVWQQVLHRHDHGDRPFVVIDKRAARLWLFDARGVLRGQAPVLLGLAHGDDAVPGIGDKPLAQIRDAERTTPAGRFRAEFGRNAHGEDILWVDYDLAVSLHRMREMSPKEHRARRLATPTSADNRISYGCINVPPAFYDGTLMKLLAGRAPVVYVLPETRPVNTLFTDG